VTACTAQAIPEIDHAFDHAFGLIGADLSRTRRGVAEKRLSGWKLIRDLSTYRRFQVNRYRLRMPNVPAVLTDGPIR
jgi:hypothetical protein